jgi:hypothetical protein
VTASGRKTTRLGLALVLFVALLLAGVLLFPRTHLVGAEIGSKHFALYEAKTDKARQNGLSGREALPDDGGMLLVFEKPSRHCFWMKDMKFSLDILWFDANYKLVHLAENVAPETYPESFCPSTDAQYVVELPAGSAKTLQLAIGSSILID